MVDSGGVVDGPVTISAQLGAGGDLATLPSGDVVWAHGWGDMTKLRVARVQLYGASR